MTEPARAPDLTRLRWAVQALARPAVEQVTLFPDFTCKADELALDFDAEATPILTARCPGLTPAGAAALRALDAYLCEVSGDGANAANWEEEALHASPVWVRIRVLAADALDAMGWANVLPPIDRGAIYVSVPTKEPSE